METSRINLEVWLWPGGEQCDDREKGFSFRPPRYPPGGSFQAVICYNYSQAPVAHRT